jgi:hypothetical protein
MNKSFLGLLLLVLFYFNSFFSYSQPKSGSISDIAFFTALNLDYVGMENVKAAVNTALTTGDYSEAKLAYLEFRRNIIKTKWHGKNPLSKPTTPITSYNTTAADRILSGYIGPMGSFNPPDFNFQHSINWTYNPVSRTDPKFTDEWVFSLNRFNFWTTLHETYWATLNEKYAEEWVYQLQDWVKKNPVDLTSSSNMTQRPLEMGLRMTYLWMNPYYAFLHSPSFTAVAHADFAKGLLAHTWRMTKMINDFVNNNSTPSNREVIEASGLGNAAILFPEFDDSNLWLQTAFKMMDSSFEKTIYPDGVQNELAPGYSLWTLQYYNVLAKSVKDNNAWSAPEYVEKIKKMYTFNMYAQDPTGYLPPTNDSNPSTVSFSEAFDTYGDAEFQYFSTGGAQGKLPAETSYKFPWAGFNIMRSSWDRNANYLFFKNGPIGAGHGHEDELSIYLVAKGRTLITDPGNFTYDASENRFYSTSTQAHNTIMVDGKQQHRYDTSSERIAKTIWPRPWMTSSVIDYASGTYDSGYESKVYQAPPNSSYWRQDKDNSATHRRDIIFLKPYYFLIADFIESSATHLYDASFHVDAPDVTINNVDKSVISRRTDNANILIKPLETNGLTVKSIKGQTNPVLGWVLGQTTAPRAIPTVIFSKTSIGSDIFANVLYPYSTSTAPAISTAVISAVNAPIWQATGSSDFENFSISIRRNGSDNIVLNNPLPITLTANADLCVTRIDKGSIIEKIALYGATSFTSANFSFTSIVKSSLKIEKNNNAISILNEGDSDVTISVSKPFNGEIMLPVKKMVYITDNGGVVSGGLPVANAGADIYISPQSTITLSGNGQSPSGLPLTYSWKLLSGAPVNIITSDNATTEVSALTAGVYKFQLTVSDGYVSVTDEVVVYMAIFMSLNENTETQIEAENYSKVTGTVNKSTSNGVVFIAGVDPGEIVEYNIYVPVGGEFKLALNCGYPNTSSQNIFLLLDKNPFVTIPLQNTGSYTTFKELTSLVNLPQGNHILSLSASNGAHSIDWLKFTPSWISGIDNTTFSNSIEIFPNPAENYIKIKNESNNPIQIYNLQGVLINSFEIYKSTVDISSIKSGVYILKSGIKQCLLIKK